MMAISREGIIVSSVSGALGSVVFYQGARAGVIGTRPHGTRSQSDDQMKRRAALVSFQAKWRANYADNQRKWNQFAKSMPWMNRLGIRRPISGYNAFLAYSMRIWPYGFGSAHLIEPPLAITTPMPTIESVTFTQGGPCNIVIDSVPTPLTNESLTITRNLAYGNRTSKGSVTFIGYESIYNTTLNWYAEITAAGIILGLGEIIKLRIFWGNGINWPTQNVEWTTTVL